MSFFLIALLALEKRPDIKQNTTGITIKWNKSDKTESLNEAILYDVECFSCEDEEDKICKLTCGSVTFSPGKENLNITSVFVTNLQPGKGYIFRVYPKNSLNKRIPRDQWNFLETRIFVPNSFSKKFCSCFISCISHAKTLIIFLLHPSSRLK